MPLRQELGEGERRRSLERRRHEDDTHEGEEQSHPAAADHVVLRLSAAVPDPTADPPSLAASAAPTAPIS